MSSDDFDGDPLQEWADALMDHLHRRPVPQYVTRQELNERLQAMSTSEQAQIDAITTEISTAATNIEAEIAALSAAHPEADLSGLKAAADSLAAIAPASSVGAGAGAGDPTTSPADTTPATTDPAVPDPTTAPAPDPAPVATAPATDPNTGTIIDPQPAATTPPPGA